VFLFVLLDGGWERWWRTFKRVTPESPQNLCAYQKEWGIPKGVSAVNIGKQRRILERCRKDSPIQNGLQLKHNHIRVIKGQEAVFEGGCSRANYHSRSFRLLQKPEVCTTKPPWRSVSLVKCRRPRHILKSSVSEGRRNSCEGPAGEKG